MNCAEYRFQSERAAQIGSDEFEQFSYAIQLAPRGATWPQMYHLSAAKVIAERLNAPGPEREPASGHFHTRGRVLEAATTSARTNLHPPAGRSLAPFEDEGPNTMQFACPSVSSSQIVGRWKIYRLQWKETGSRSSLSPGALCPPTRRHVRGSSSDIRHKSSTLSECTRAISMDLRGSSGTLDFARHVILSA